MCRPVRARGDAESSGRNGRGKGDEDMRAVGNGEGGGGGEEKEVNDRRLFADVSVYVFCRWFVDIDDSNDCDYDDYGGDRYLSREL